MFVYVCIEIYKKITTTHALLAMSWSQHQSVLYLQVTPAKISATVLACEVRSSGVDVGQEASDGLQTADVQTVS